MGRFSEFYPAVSFSFFMLIILLTVITSNPVYALISFAGAFLYRLRLVGKASFSYLKFIIPLIIFAGIFNMIFSHYGSVKLFTVGSYDFMLESLVFGLFTGVMLGAVIIWFACYTDVITSEKFMALFSSFMPNLALLFSMVLRFIPLMVKTSNEIKEANIGMGKEIKGLKNSINRFSCLVSISLEKSIETADSMKSRGFGKGKRKPYIKYKFKLADGVMLSFTVIIFAFMVISDFLNINSFAFEPKLAFSNENAVFYILFGIFAALPVIIDFAEEIKWHFLKLKI